jgi:hypothetical protein
VYTFCATLILLYLSQYFFREPLSLCLWARHAHLLAVGTSKGNLLLYNHRTRRLFILLYFILDITAKLYLLEELLCLVSTLKGSPVGLGVIRFVCPCPSQLILSPVYTTPLIYIRIDIQIKVISFCINAVIHF